MNTWTGGGGIYRASDRGVCITDETTGRAGKIRDINLDRALESTEVSNTGRDRRAAFIHTMIHGIRIISGKHKPGRTHHTGRHRAEDIDFEFEWNHRAERSAGDKAGPLCR